MEAEAPLEQRADGQSVDPPMLRLHCLDNPRPEGNHMTFNHFFFFGNKERLHEKGSRNALT